MRVLFVVFVAASTFSLAADIDELRSDFVTVGGSFRYRIQQDDRTDLTNNPGYSVLRVRPDFTLTPSKSSTVFFQPSAVKYFGATPQGTDPLLSFHQAYGDYHPSDFFSLAAGRQVLSYGDELVLGGDDWTPYGRSFDAVKVHLSPSPSGWADFFASKLADNNIFAPGPGDIDLFGVYSNYKSVDLYLLTRHNAPTAKDLYTIGLRVASHYRELDYRFEGDEQFPNYSLDAQIGYTLFPWIDFHLSFEGFVASREYDPLYPNTHKWLGFADVLGRRNLMGFAIRGRTQVSSHFAALFDLYAFFRSTIFYPSYGLDAKTPLGSPDASSSRNVGTELDLTLKYTPTKSASFGIAGDLFFPGTFLKTAYPNINLIDRLEAVFEIKL